MTQTQSNQGFPHNSSNSSALTIGGNTGNLRIIRNSQGSQGSQDGKSEIVSVQELAKKYGYTIDKNNRCRTIELDTSKIARILGLTINHAQGYPQEICEALDYLKSNRIPKNNWEVKLRNQHSLVVSNDSLSLVGEEVLDVTFEPVPNKHDVLTEEQVLKAKCESSIKEHEELLQQLKEAYLKLKNLKGSEERCKKLAATYTKIQQDKARLAKALEEINAEIDAKTTGNDLKAEDLDALFADT